MKRNNLIYRAAILTLAAIFVTTVSSLAKQSLTLTKGKNANMQPVNKLMMLTLAVKDMPAAKAFYSDILGMKITTDYRQDDAHWWVTLDPPQSGATITLTTFNTTQKPGVITIYFETSDVKAAHNDLKNKNATISEVKDDLFGPGSGVQWCSLDDPDGNTVYLAQSHEKRSPF